MLGTRQQRRALKHCRTALLQDVVLIFLLLRRGSAVVCQELSQPAVLLLSAASPALASGSVRARICHVLQILPVSPSLIQQPPIAIEAAWGLSPAGPALPHMLLQDLKCLEDNLWRLQLLSRCRSGIPSGCQVDTKAGLLTAHTLLQLLCCIEDNTVHPLSLHVHRCPDAGHDLLPGHRLASS